MAALLLMLALSTAVVVAHSAMTGHDMGDALVMCVAAAATTAGVGMVAAAGCYAKRWRAPHSVTPPTVADVSPPPAPVPIAARAGPAAWQVFLL